MANNHAIESLLVDRPRLAAPRSAEVVREEILDLTSRMVKGEEAAFRGFHELYFDRLFRYVLVLMRGDEDSARDALQDAFLRVVRHIKPFSDDEKFWSWLTVLARSAVVDAARKNSRYWKFLKVFAATKAPVELTRSNDIDDRLLGVLDEILDALSQPERDLIASKYLEGNSVQQIATSFGETEKAIESRLSRVKRKLRERILNQLKNEK